jgi:hypothetical protein
MTELINKILWHDVRVVRTTSGTGPVPDYRARPFLNIP